MLEGAPGKEPEEKAAGWGRALSKLWIGCALVVGSAAIAVGLWNRAWLLVLFGIPWLSVAALMRLNEREPLPIVEDSISGPESRVSSEHPRHHALFGLTVLAIGLLVALTALGVGEHPSSSRKSTAGAICGGLIGFIGAWILSQGLYTLWRRRVR